MFSEMIRNLIIVILRIVDLIETYQLFRCSQKKIQNECADVGFHANGDCFYAIANLFMDRTRAVYE